MVAMPPESENIKIKLNKMLMVEREVVKQERVLNARDPFRGLRDWRENKFNYLKE